MLKRSRYLHWLIPALLSASLPVIAADDSPPELFELLNRAGAEQTKEKVRYSTDYKPSGSKWVDGLDESSVFFAAVETPGLRLGIGKGGQIYSLRGPFGEGLPPQRPNAPWMDEVWHLVVTNENLVAPIHDFQNSDPKNNWDIGMPLQYFIHQAGIYLEGLTGTRELGASKKAFSSPMVASRWDAKTRTLYLANWAQQARSPNVWKSGVLVFTAYRFLGNGAVEVTQALTNFGSEDLTYLNAPWGGVRNSSLPQTILSKPDGSWVKASGRWGWEGIPKSYFTDTGGWIAWTSNQTADADNALALVFGTEPEGQPAWKRHPNRILHGTAGEASLRDYNVVEAASSITIKPGETLACRWFLVSGTFEQVRQRAAKLAPLATMWMPEPTDTRLKVWMVNGKPSLKGKGNPAFELFAKPAPGLAPVFAMEDTRDGSVFPTDDPYLLTRTAPAPNPLPEKHPEHAQYTGRHVHYPYESPGVLRKLLGFARKESLPEGGHALISADGIKIPLKTKEPNPPSTSAAKN